MSYVRIAGFVTLLLRLLMAAVGPVWAAAPLPADQAFQFARNWMRRRGSS